MGQFQLINWWAVLTVTALNMFVGFLWYGPLFGTFWLSLVGKKAEEIEGGNATTYLIPMAGALVSAVVLAVVISLLRVYTWWSGLAWGALLWFAFGATGLLTTGVFEERKQGLTWLFVSYMVLVHAAGGAILASWR